MKKVIFIQFIIICYDLNQDNNNKDEDCNNKDSMNKKHSAQSYERLVQRLRIMAQVIIDIEAQNK